MKKRTKKIKGWGIECPGRGVKLGAVFVKDYKALLKALADQPAEPSLMATLVKGKRAKA